MQDMLQQVASSATAMGPAILLHGIQLQRPIDLLKAPALPADDKRTIPAAWASNFHAADSRHAFLHIPGTPEPVSVDEVQSALRELDRRYGP